VPLPNTIKKKGKAGGGGSVMEEMNLFKVHCMHAWNYLNEIPSYD
jgi:hypothetical protein